VACSVRHDQEPAAGQVRTDYRRLSDRLALASAAQFERIKDRRSRLAFVS
jgi:hypothetical protein